MTAGDLTGTPPGGTIGFPKKSVTIVRTEVGCGLKKSVRGVTGHLCVAWASALGSAATATTASCRYHRLVFAIVAVVLATVIFTYGGTRLKKSC